MRKQRDTRIVTLEQDYAPGGVVVGAQSGLPYSKGSTHAIHVDTVEKLKRNGVKMKVEKPDWDKIHSRIKANRSKQTQPA